MRETKSKESKDLTLNKPCKISLAKERFQTLPDQEQLIPKNSQFPNSNVMGAKSGNLILKRTVPTTIAKTVFIPRGLFVKAATRTGIHSRTPATCKEPHLAHLCLSMISGGTNKILLIIHKVLSIKTILTKDLKITNTLNIKITNILHHLKTNILKTNTRDSITKMLQDSHSIKINTLLGVNHKDMDKTQEIIAKAMEIFRGVQV
jgi:hypothetical protein